MVMLAAAGGGEARREAGPPFFERPRSLLLLLTLVVIGLRRALVLLRSRRGWLLRLGGCFWSICHSMYPLKRDAVIDLGTQCNWVRAQR